MGRYKFYILSYGFAFFTLIFAFSFKSLTTDPWPLTPVISTLVERALQIHLFLTNKANFRKSQVNVTDLVTMNYGKMDTWSGRKNKAKTKPIQTQYKAKTKPIQTQFKPNTNPIQTQFKPNLSRRSLWRSRNKAYFRVKKAITKAR